MPVISLSNPGPGTPGKQTSDKLARALGVRLTNCQTGAGLQCGNCLVPAVRPIHCSPINQQLVAGLPRYSFSRSNFR
jgi:hypothetical protein